MNEVNWQAKNGKHSSLEARQNRRYEHYPSDGIIQSHHCVFVCVKTILTPPNFYHSYHYLDSKVHKAHKMIPPHNLVPRIGYPPVLEQCFPPWHKTALTVGVSGPKKVQNK